MIVGEGMFHCYPVFPFVCKEAEEGWNQMGEILKVKDFHDGLGNGAVTI